MAGAGVKTGAGAETGAGVETGAGADVRAVLNTRRASRACRSPTTAARYAAAGTPCGAGAPVIVTSSPASRSAIDRPTSASSCCMRVRYCRIASQRPSGTADRSSWVNRPTSQGGGGGTTTERPVGTRSRTTSVPANTSPSRRPRADIRDARQATTPKVIRISTIPIAPRTRAWRNRIGPPSSRTTRSPHASLPSERPWLRVSTATGPPTSTRRKAATPIAATAASSKETAAIPKPMDTRMNTATTTARSIAKARARLGSLAGRNPRTTASPVTSSFIATHPSSAFPAPPGLSLPS